MAAMRIVLETNILARAHPRTRGPVRKLLKIIIESSGHVLITWPFILSELERVLNYPRLQRIWPLQPSGIVDYIGVIETLSELVIPGCSAHTSEDDFLSLLKDLDDNPILQTALLGRAEMLCTLDRHFYKPDVIQFCRDRGLRILADVELFTELMAA